MSLIGIYSFVDIWTFGTTGADLSLIGIHSFVDIWTFGTTGADLSLIGIFKVVLTLGKNPLCVHVCTCVHVCMCVLRPPQKTPQAKY